MSSVVDVAGGKSLAMIGLGSNLDFPLEQIRRAVGEIGGLPECRVCAVSSMYESAPIGGVEQPVFINAVAQIETSLSPQALMANLLDIERAHHRVRVARNGSRTLDLDILVFGDQCIDEPSLVIPHAAMHQRAFVLLPLIELNPELTIPGRGLAREFLSRVGGQTVRKLLAMESQSRP